MRMNNSNNLFFFNSNNIYRFQFYLYSIDFVLMFYIIFYISCFILLDEPKIGLTKWNRSVDLLNNDKDLLILKLSLIILWANTIANRENANFY